MADRITNAHLEQLCKVINRAMGTPVEAEQHRQKGAQKDA